MLAVLSAPANNDRSPRYMEKALAAIHQGLAQGETVALCYEVHEGSLCLTVECAETLRNAVHGPLIANYPRARVEVVERSTNPSSQQWSLEVGLCPDLFPILRHSQFEDMLTRSYADPIDSLLHALRPDEQVRLQLRLIVSPARKRRCRRAKKGLELLERSFFDRHRRLAEWFSVHVTSERNNLGLWLLARLARASSTPLRGAPLDVTASNRHEREADLQAAADKLGGHVYAASLQIVAESADQPAALARLNAVAGALGSVTRSRLAVFTVSPARAGLSAARGRTFLLSNEELATIWHPPTVGVIAEGMQLTGFTELQAPPVLPASESHGAVVLGRTAFRNDQRIVAIRREDRRRHVHVIGRTGVGKTTLLLSQIASDIVRGEGVGIIDPHGDLADHILRLIPRHRTNDVVVFDASDAEYAVAFNPLACSEPGRIDQVTSGAVSALKKLYDSWGPRLENTLRNAVFATVEQHGTLLSVLRLLTDDAYRERVVPLVRDEVVRAFWQHEFATWSKPYRTEAVAAITNKIQPFLTNSRVRAIVSQSGRSLNLRQIMDDGKILVANLSKGKIGEDNSALLGAFLVTAIQQAAMTRADVPEESRRDFFLSIDEFQNFVTTSFETILSEARKYRLNLTVSHQYLAQLNEQTAAAIAGNIGTMVSFAVGSSDAEWLATAMASTPDQLSVQDFTNLPKFTAYVRPLVDGVPCSPFSVVTPPPPPVQDDRSHAVIASSRRQFSRPIVQVQSDIGRELSRS